MFFKLAPFLSLFFISTLSFSDDRSLKCLYKGKNLPVDDATVLKLEKTTQNQYTTQARVDGFVSEIYPDRNGHHHFAIQFNEDTRDGIEVVYNDQFGVLPDIKVGMKVEACGEYITSNKATAQYPASPMGAIIHWVHINPSKGPKAHPSGFLVIDGSVYGQNKPTN